MKRSRLKPRSDKMWQKMIIYNKLRIEYLSKFPRCQCVFDKTKRLPTCTYKATDIHHVRGRNGHLLTDTNNWMAVCRSCHNEIEVNRKWSKTHGFLKSKHNLEI